MTIANFIGCGLIGLLIAAASLAYGFTRGRAIGWYEGYQERERVEKEKRNRLGQFRKVMP